MYQLFGIRSCLAIFGFACGFVLVIWVWFAPPSEIDEAWDLISGSVAIVSAVVVLLGQTPIFPKLCRLPGLNLLFPDIDGHWTGRLETNWHVMRERANLPSDAETASDEIVEAEIRIRSRLFFIHMNLKSKSGYSTSKTIFVRVSRDAEDGEVRLHYMYENTTLKPKPTDASKHDGAAYLDLKQTDDNRPYLEGVYWTNRNWHQALNTAGKAVFEKA